MAPARVPAPASAPVPAEEPAPAPRAVDFATGDDPAMEEARFPLRPRRRRRKVETGEGAAHDEPAEAPAPDEAPAE
jgi:hypothetical protein